METVINNISAFGPRLDSTPGAAATASDPISQPQQASVQQAAAPALSAAAGAFSRPSGQDLAGVPQSAPKAPQFLVGAVSNGFS